MNKLYKFLFIFTILVFSAFKGFSTHIIGGSLTYVNNGSNSYTITLTMYRDCCPTCTAYPATAVVNVYRADGTAYTPATVTLNPVSTTNITATLPPCATAPASPPCAQERIYQATVTLPPSPGGLHLYYSVCCRNGTISNINNPGGTGESFYAFIPGYKHEWIEGFVLANGVTVDAGATAWTKTNGATAPTSAQVNNGLFEVTGANNGSVTWTSQTVNISSYTSGVNLSVNASKAGTLEAGDSLKIYYSLNGGPLTLFPVNGQLLGNFASPAVATATGLSGSTIQIVIKAIYNNTSPNSEIYRWDMVSITENQFVANSSPVFGTPPPLYLCAVNTFNINYSATDVDGDSLVYSMYTPYSDVAPTFPENTAAFTPVTWLAGYSASSPFNSGGPGLTINSSTGMLTGVVNSLGQYVFGVMCSEYRNGILISQIVRDFQANVVNCPPFVPTTPTASTSNPSPVCSGQNLNLTATSPDVGVTYTWTGPNGFTSTLQNPTISNVTVAASGTYSVTATVSGCTSTAGTIIITVNPTPAAPTASSNSPVCVGSTLNLTSTVVTGATYSWTGPNSFTAAVQNPSIASATATAAGTYSVVATVAGCLSPAATTAVTINPTPSAPTAGSNGPVCIGATLNLTASTIAGATYSWTGPNGFTSALQNSSIAGVTALAAGTYSVTATAGGCTSTFGTITVVVNATPAAPTAGSNGPVCVGSTLNLTASTVAGATYSWTGPNGFTSSTQNPTIAAVTAAAAGTYSVTATVGGCTSAFGTIAVTVNPTPAAPTAGSNSPVCAGTTLNLTASNVAGATYSWTGPNGFTSSSQNPSIAGVTAAAAGTYSVSATVSGCTSAFGTTAITVNPIPATPTASSNSPVCTGSSLSLTTSAVAGATYSWTGPNGFTSASQNPSIASVTAAAAGTYSLTITVSGCSSLVDTTTVVVNATPVAPTATNNGPVCIGATLNLTASAIAGATYSWTGPNGFTSSSQNPSIANVTAAASGTYSVTAAVSGCTGPAGTTVVVVSPVPATPTASSNSPVCSGTTLNLTASNVAGATYSWTGPNGFTSSLQNPSIVAITTAGAGTYSVTATVAGCTGAFGTTTVVVNATPAVPTPSSNSPVCVGSSLNLTTNAVTGATYSWTGPNGFTSTSQNPTISGVTLAASGTYSITTTVTGCASTAGTTVVTVNPIPTAPTAGSNTPVCNGGTLNLTASNVAGATYSWIGPNGFTSSSQNPSIAGATPAASGTYSVTATVNGCTSIFGTVVVVVNMPPSTTPTVGSNSPVCSGTAINLTVNTITGATYSWTGPNGFTSTLQNPTIASALVASAGTYSVIATVPGCAVSPVGTTTVVVNATPSAPTAGSNTPVCVGSTINLTASNVAGATYNWTGPNGFTSSTQNPSIAGATALAAGTYSVSVTVNGCTGAVGTTSVVMTPTPATPTITTNSPVCVGGTITLSTTAVAGATYSWTGPNGFTASSQNTSVINATVAAAGTYSLTTTVSGCTSLAGTAAVVVNSPPTAPTAGSNSPVCTGTAINLTASTIAGATYNWTGPNGFTSTLQNPTVASAVLASAGTYSVTANNGCVSSPGTVVVVVNATPAAPTATNNGPLCVGATLNLTAGNIAGATYSWTGPNGFTSSSQNPSITNVTAVNAGVYSVTATVNGCTSVIRNTTVVINPIPATPAPSSNSPVCAGSALNLTTTAVAGATYSWTGPNGFTSALQNPSITSPTVAASGTYSLTVTVSGCTSIAGTTSVTVNPIPSAPTTTSNSPVCISASIDLTASTIAGATYSWTGPNGFTSSSQSPSISGATASMAGTYSVTATVSGCASAFGTTTVVVSPIPATPTASSNSAVCEGATLNLTASNVAGATYSWSGPNGYSSSTQNPSIAGVTLPAAGTYSVTATVAGCTGAAGTTVVVVNPIPSVPTATSNSPLCVGSALNLSASTVTGATYSWTGPNGFTSSTQNPTIASATLAAAGTYSVTANVAGCGSAFGTTIVVVNPIPAAPTASSNSPVCNGGTLNLTASNIAGATYSWTGPNGFTASTQNPSIAGVTTAAAGTYSVTATVNGCTSVIRTINVIVNNPALSAPTTSNNSPVCTGTAINLTAGAITSASYSWTGPNGFTSALQNPTIASAVLASTGTYSVVATVPGCGASPVGTTVVVVNATPSAPTVSSNSPVCDGSSINLTASTIAGATYNWTGPNGFTSAVQNPSITGASTTAAGTYSVTATVNGCTGAVGTTAVTITPTPATPATSSNSPLCVGATINLSTPTVTGATYSWTGPNGFTSSLQNPSITNASLAADGTYSLTITVAGCTSAAGSTIVTINSSPATPVAGSNTPVCTGTAINLTVDTIPGATYSWTGPNGFTSTLQNPTVTSAVVASAGTYTVVANNGCASLPATTVVVVNVTPAAPTATNNGPLCEGATLNLTAGNVAGATYNWTGPNGFTSSSQNPSISGVTTANAGVYSVSVTVNGCTSVIRNTTVVVNPIPSPPSSASSNSPVCEGAALNLIASTVTGASYNWTGPNGFTSTNQNPSISAVTLAADGVYSVTATVNGCVSTSAATTTVVVNPTPATPILTNSGPLCEGSTLDLTASNIVGATYSWTGPNSFTSSTQNPSINSITVADAGTYSVVATVNGCSGVAGTTVVVVNPIPLSSSAASNSPICVGATLNLTASTIAGATYNWTGPNGFTSTTQNPSIVNATVAEDGVYSVTATVNGCTSTASSTTVAVNSAPVTPTASSNSPVCTTDSLLLNVTTVSGAVYSWTGPNGFTSTLQNPFIAGVTTLAAGTYTVIANNGCASSPATTVVVVNTKPSSPIATTNSALCEGGNLNLNASNVAGGSYSWTGPNSYTSSTQNNTISGVTILNAGTYSVTVTVNGCTSNAGVTTVVINQPAIANAGTDQSVCSNNPLVTIAGTVSGGSLTGIWSSSGTGTFNPSTTDLNATYLPSAADTTAGSVVLTLTSTGNGACPAAVSSITVTITDAPTANAGADQSVCANNSNVTLNGSVSIASGGVWYTSGDGSFVPDATTLNATYIPGANDLLAGSITLTLATTGNGTCLADSSQMNITITGSPTANAGVDQFLCLSSPNASLTGIITGSPTGQWTSLGTGSFSPSATSLNTTYIPSAADTAAGSVLLILTSTNNGGCNAVSDSVFITFTDIPVVVAGAGQTVCANNAVVSLNGSVTVGSTTGIWSTSGTGTFSPSATSLNATYAPSAADNLASSVTLTLSSTNACVVVTDNLVLTITPAPVVDAGADIFVCANNADAAYAGSVSGGSTTGIWTSTGSGSFSPNVNSLAGTYTPSAADISAGNVLLILTSDNNGTCLPVSDTLQLTITPPPTIFAGNDTSFCASSTLTLNGTLTGGAGTVIWSTSGSGTFAPDAVTINATYVPSTADTTAGVVTLTLTSTNNGGCLAATDDMIATITDAPTVDAGIDQIVCANNAVINLTAAVTTATGVQWSTLGDGTFTSAASLSTDYSPGVNDVASSSIVLVATSTGNGTCTAITDTVLIQITPSPIVNAGSTLFVCEGIMTANLAGSVLGPTTTGIWSTLGSGSFSLDTDLNATYTMSTADTTAGNVMLILTSTNNGNCNAVSDTVQIIITTQPTTIAGNDIVACANNSSTVLAGVITGGAGQGQWTSSGTGTFSPSDTTLNASYQPSNADISGGAVTLVLTPINTCNPIVDSLVITYTPAPTVNAGSDTTICGGTLPINLLGSMNTVATGAIWTSNGSGTFAPSDTVLNTVYTPLASDPDTLVFVLTTTGNGLCNSVNDTMMVFRNVAPTAGFIASNLCEGQTVQFTDTSNANGATITSWSWNFGASTSVLQNPSYSFSTAGTYTVSLVVSSGLGCTDSTSNVITVNPLPVVQFTSDVTSGCSPVCVNFTDGSTVASGAIVSWDWDFGGVDSSVTQNPTYCFTNAGVYSIGLTVVDNNGCSNSITNTDMISVYPLAQASFVANTDCISTTVSFVDSSSNVSSWSWSFGDGSTSTVQNPVYTYSTSGTYTVTLVSTSMNGCSDSISLTVITGEPVTADYIPHGGTYNTGQVINFTNQSTGAVSYVWDFGNGSPTVTDEDPIYSYTVPGDYSVLLVSTNSAGCSDTVTYVFTINSTGYATPTGFTPNGDGVNDFFYILGNFSEYELRVFNEWGNQIFMSNSQADKWDGTYKGAKQPAGTYVYIFNGKVIDGEELKLNGEINLIR